MGGALVRRQRQIRIRRQSGSCASIAIGIAIARRSYPGVAEESAQQSAPPYRSQEASLASASISILRARIRSLKSSGGAAGRPAEEIALNVVASALPEKERLPCRFNAFSNDAQPQSMAMIAAVIAASSG